MAMIYDGKRITTLREERGLSMAELARRSGIRQPSLWAIENERTKQPRAQTLLSISRALGVPLQEILRRPKRAEEGSDPSEVLAILEALDPRDRVAWVTVGRSLLGRK